MYVRSKVARGKTYYQIMEEVGDGERVRQRIVLALGRTPDPRVALKQWRRGLESLRRKRAILVPLSGTSKTAVRIIGSVDARIAETEAKIKTLTEIINNKSVGTTLKRKQG